MTETDPLSILVVEDVEINQLLLAAVLERLGHAMEVASDGADAIDRVEQASAEGRSFDLVLMDLQMPGVDGLEATRTIRSLGFDASALPIIALTANNQPHIIAACYDAGMQGHLTKPLLRPALESLLAGLSGRSPCQAPGPPDPLDSVDPALRGRYAARKAAVIERLDAMIRGDRFDDDEAGGISGDLHKLAGVAAMFGEPLVGALAATIERKIVEWSVAERRDQLAGLAHGLLQAA